MKNWKISGIGGPVEVRLLPAAGQVMEDYRQWLDSEAATKARLSGSVSGGVHAGKNVSVDVYGSLSLYANLHATLGVRVQSNYGQGTIDAVGSFTGNAGVKGKAYARASIYGFYFDKLFFEFDETMFDKPLWADEVALANIYRW